MRLIINLVALALGSLSVVDADCTGYPDGCCKSERRACESIEGCKWTGGFLYGKCQGIPKPCEDFWNDRSQCVIQGCTFGPNEEWLSGYFCTGTPIPVPICIGDPGSCSNSNNIKYACELKDGCTWEPDPDFSIFGKCTGTPIPCEEFASDECQCKRQGCIYNEDPPEENESFYDAIMPVREGIQALPGEAFFWEKCRDSRDGRVCYIEGLAACVMKIENKYCSCWFCPEGGRQFDCTDALSADYGGVVGRDCSGACIWGANSSITPTTTTDTISTPAPPTTTNAITASIMPSETRLDFATFDTSWDGWKGGGRGARRSRKDIPFCPHDTVCVRLRDNSGESSSIFKNFTDTSNFTALRVDFSFNAVSMEVDEYFFLEFKNVNDSSFTQARNWTVSTDFNNNEIIEDESVEICPKGGFSFSSIVTLRFRCDAPGNGDRIYIDNINVTGLSNY